jgi:phosphate starvation-inducible PhoH-like protein
MPEEANIGGAAVADASGPAVVTVRLPAAGAGIVAGPRDENLRRIEAHFPVRLSARGEEVRIQGDAEPVSAVAQLLEELGRLVESGFRPSGRDFETALRVAVESPGASLVDFFLESGVSARASRLVTPRSLNQKAYLELMSERDLVFAIGPAGTGKTYLAVAVAAASLLEKKVQRVVLTRPAVEAGEKLGFLPGDLVEKVNPFLRPLYDALYDILGFEKVARLIERNIIEIAPLAFMRGRTLNDSFIILDEAQNTTPEQMKMFVTRIGFGSRAVVTGDVTQVDLPSDRPSGLVDVRRVLREVSGIGFVEFGEADVVRHPLVRRIVNAYDRRAAR